MTDIAVTVTRDLIGVEDLALGDGTFTRSTSTGGTQEITKINADSLDIASLNTPEKYGAVGDGETDDSVALQELFDAGGDIYIPGKTYMSSKGPLIINSDGCKIWCQGTIKLMDGAERWPVDGAGEPATAVLHIRDCKDVTWTGGIIDGNDCVGVNGLAVGHNLIFRNEVGEYCYRTCIQDVVIRNCPHDTSVDPGGSTPHDGGVGNGGGKGLTLQFGLPQTTVSNIRIHDCTIGMSYEGGSSNETATPDLVVNNVTIKDCMIGLHLRGLYGPSGGDDLGADEFSSLWSNIVFVDCGVDNEPTGVDVNPTDFGVINAIKCTNLSMVNFRIRNTSGPMTPIRGQYRNCYFNGEIDARQIEYVLNFKRDLNGADPTAGETPSRHNVFDLRLKVRGAGTAGDQITQGIITDAGSDYLTQYNQFKISYLIGDGANDFAGNYSELTSVWYENDDSDDFDSSNTWEIIDRGSGKWAMGSGVVRNLSDEHKDGVAPAFPTQPQFAISGLWAQNDVINTLLRLKAADGTTPLAFGVPGNSAAGTAAYIDSNGFRIANSYPFMLPVMTSTTRDAISPVIEGMTIYNSTTDQINVYANGAWRYWALT